MADSTGDLDPLERLADSFLNRFRRGERPSIDDYAAAHPELAEEIRGLLPALVALEQDLSVQVSSAGLDSQPRRVDASPSQLGDYVIHREIGRGGMGIVYEATQHSLGRHVALKVLPHSALGEIQRERFRLEARAAAKLHHSNIVPVFGVGETDGVHYYAMQYIAGQGLHEVIEELRRQRGTDQASAPAASQPSPMETAAKPTAQALSVALVANRFEQIAALGEVSTEAAPLSSHEEDAAIVDSPTASLSSHDDGAATIDFPGPPSWRSGNSVSNGTPSPSSRVSSASSEGQFYRAIVRIGLQVAEALDYAHGQGILHRDIKPSNLLLDLRGTVWVTDFGLAKAEGVEGLTETGDVVGTLRYMAPERFDGWSDRRTDLYALGATLYELVTLQPVHDAPNRAKLIEKVLHDAPIPPRKHDGKIPRDLETIILKALSREPSARYATAEVMAEDLRRFLADRPILARRTGAAEKTWRWCRRNPAVASLLATLTVVFLSGFIVVTFAWRNADALRALAEQRREESGKNEREANLQRHRAQVEAGRARSAVDAYLNKVTESQQLAAPGLDGLRRDLLKSALGFYQEFLKEHEDDPGLRLAQAQAEFRSSRIISLIESPKAGRESANRAKRIYEEVHRERPEDDEARAGLAEVFLWEGRPFRAIALLGSTIRRHPRDPHYLQLWLDSLNGAALNRQKSNDYDAALEYFLRAYECASTLVAIDPKLGRNQTNLAAILNNVGTMLGVAPLSRNELALDLYRHAFSHSTAVLAETPNDITAARFGLINRGNIARTLWDLGLVDAGRSERIATVEFAQRHAARNPEIRALQEGLINTMRGKADSECLTQDYDQAAATLGETVVLLRRAESARPHSQVAFDLAADQARLVGLLDRGAHPASSSEADHAVNPEQAVAALDRSIQQGFRDVNALKVDPRFDSLRGRPDFEALIHRAAALAREEALSPRPAESTRGDAAKSAAATTPAADSAKGDAVAAIRRAARIEASDFRYATGLLLGYQGRHEAGMRLLRDALAERESLLRESPGDPWASLRVAEVHEGLFQLWHQQSRFDEADRELALYLEQADRLLATHPADSEITSWLGILDTRIGFRFGWSGLWEDALAFYRRGWANSPRAYWLEEAYMPGLLQWTLGDREGFRETCRLAFEYAQSRDNSWLRAGHSRLFAIGKDSGIDREKAVALAADGARREGDGLGWMTLFSGVNLYRANRLDDAERTINSLQDDIGQKQLGTPVRAMIAKQRGHVGEAKVLLAEARAIHRERVLRAMNRKPGANEFTAWLNWLEFHAFLMEAIEVVEGHPAQNPWFPLFSARSEAMRGHHEKAEALLEQAGRLAPEDADLLTGRARVWAEMGRNDLAVADLDHALAIDPESFQALCEKGRINLRGGRTELGLADLLKALKRRSPSEIEADMERARVDNEIAASDAAYRIATGAGSGDPPLYLARGRYLAWHGRWAEAEAEIRRAGLPAQSERWLQRASLLLLAGDVEGYRTLCRRMNTEAAGISDDHRSALARVLSFAPNDARPPAEVAAMAYETVNAHPTIAWYRYAWGLAAIRAGQDDLAAARFNEALTTDPNWNGRVLCWLGLALTDAKRGLVDEGCQRLAMAERWLEETGRDANAQTMAYPPKVADVDWIEANLLAREAREVLKQAEAASSASTPASAR